MDHPTDGRVHLVLVPGFAGFDALGQLEYYAGVTPLFRTWQGTRPGAARRAVLHYFDNLPTAGVATRAARLQRYLATRFARGELAPGDTLGLVGHSTGGLDIRRAVLELEADSRRGQRIAVDGAAGASVTVDPADLLALLRRVVFLSVPQRGTNLADWVQAYRTQREVLVTELRASVLAAQVAVIDRAQAWVAARAARTSDADLLLAVQDALAEIDERALRPGERTPAAVAAAQQAFSELSLWLRHIATDFSAIDDLAVSAPPQRPSPARDASPPRRASPAQVDPGERAAELELWARLGVQTRSYATVGPRPFAFEPGAAAPRWSLLKPTTYPALTPQTPDARGMDFVYRACYRACAGGPFAPDGGGAQAVATSLGTRQARAIEVWDNDGIVNTASMLWPDGDRTLLVEGDHGDIIGHHRLVRATQPSPRAYHTYDLLRSAPKVEAERFSATFEQVWRGVFEFAAS
jgi:triacylglycerol lipase